MIGRIILLSVGSLAILVTSFCVHKNTSLRFVSSGGGVPQVDQWITVPMDGGHRWLISKNTPGEPTGVLDLLVYFQCEGDSDPTLFDEALRVSSSPQQPGISAAKSWGELKRNGIRTYQRHNGSQKPQDVKSVVVIQFYPVQEIQLARGDNQTPSNANTSKQVVIDIADVCSY